MMEMQYVVINREGLLLEQVMIFQLVEILSKKNNCILQRKNQIVVMILVKTYMLYQKMEIVITFMLMNMKYFKFNFK